MKYLKRGDGLDQETPPLLRFARGIGDESASCGPLAVQAILRTHRRTEGLDEAAALTVSDEIGWPVLGSRDAEAGTRAFREKRPAVFTGYPRSPWPRTESGRLVTLTGGTTLGNASGRSKGVSMVTHTERGPHTREQTRTPRRWTGEGRSHRRGGLGRLIWRLAMAAALVLLLGIALTWAGANPGNGIVHGILRAGGWLATPFRDVFTNTDPRERLAENWLLAAGAYLLGGRILSWAFGARVLLWHFRR